MAAGSLLFGSDRCPIGPEFGLSEKFRRLSKLCGEGCAPPNKGLQLTTNSSAFLTSLPFWRRDFCGMVLTVSAVCCS